ncbi:hypothetical protein DQ04_07061000 [Trypanosoma grayi]|uniref:hypothetical protein n=1 Tax=Trypanosoma grayi TaxID=71804 RepID=UPI0004F42E83|nr:hypothetical protein DQ04_07061000 [Trypanosoma grayi]KEG08491.1 hypothetical protein DQ04_07061000 [Trypanosoma grayi]
MSSSDDSLMRVIDSSPIVGINPNGRQNRSKKHLIRRNEPSKNRVHQKRWLSEVKIVSVILPCIEVKALTELPPPPENMTPGVTTGNGVYTTMLGVRSFQFVMQQAMPPAHAAMQLKMSTISASVTFSSLAIITQVEYEPLAREGNLRIKVPGIAYDEEKDTLAVSYLTSFCGRGKQDSTHGVESGTCRVTLDTVAFHLTRNFFHYVGSIKAMLLQLHNVRLPRQLQLFSHASTPEPMVIHHEQADSLCDFIFPSLSPSLSDVPFASMGNFGIEANRIVQGVGSINTLRVELVDVYREGRYMRVHTEHANLMEVTRPSAKFFAMVPIKRKGEHLKRLCDMKNSVSAAPPSMTADPSVPFCEPPDSLLPPERRRRQHRDAEVHFIGEVNSLVVKCYPSVLHIIGATKELNVVSAAGVAVHNEGASHQSVPVLLRDLLSSPATGTAGAGIGVVLKGSFTFHQLDVSMLHSDLNFMQFKGSKLTGYGESRTERVSSRECVQTHVLTEAISENLRERLQSWLRRARERAPKTRYAAPPSVTPQLHLKNSAFFFAETIFLQYVADSILPTAPGVGDTTPLESPRTHEESRVFLATATQLAVGVHQADQNNVNNSDGNAKSISENEPKMIEKGVQMNLQVEIGKITLSSPYRPQATETVQPQLHQWLREWVKSRKILRAMRSSYAASVGQENSFLPVPAKTMYAWCCAVQIREMRMRTDLPQSISVELNVPLASAFLNASSDERMALKANVHPFSLTSKSPSTGKHVVELPNIYVIYAKDEARRTGNCLMESLEITVFPSIISHVLLISDRFLTAYAALSKPVLLDEDDENDANMSPREDQPIPLSSGWKGRFMFLLEGLRISYLTSMTNLRFSVRRLNALAYMSSWMGQRPTHLVANVANAQIALVDRDDYDQLQSSLRQAAMVSRSDASVPSTKAAFLHHPSVSATFDDSARAVRPLGGYIWGLFETSFTLSGGRSVTKERMAALENLFIVSPGTPLTLNELEMLSSTAMYWNLSVLSPLIIARIGLVSLLKQSFDETKDLAEKMRFATQREGRLFRRQLAKSAAYRRLARVRKQIDADIEKTGQSRMERLRELASKAIPRSSMSFSRRISLESRGEANHIDSDDANFFNATSGNKFLVNVTNFLVVMPFGDSAYRSILDELPDVYVSGRGAATLNRKRFIPTMALKVKVDNTTVSCCFLTSRRCVPVIHPSRSGEEFGLFFGPMEQDTMRTEKFTARLSMDDAYFYCSDGSPLATDASAKELLSSTHILGGRGTLTSLERNEYRHSMSKIYFSSIEIPLHVSMSDSDMNIGAVVDMSAPQIALSTRIVSILSQISQEIPSKPFPHFLKSNRACPVASTAATTTATTTMRTVAQMANNIVSSQTVSSLSEAPASVEGKRRHFDPMSPLGELQETEKTPTLYHIDLTARIERGEIRMYALEKGNATPGASTTLPILNPSNAKVARSQRRRVKFSSSAAEANSSATTCSADGTGAGSPMALLLTIPLPSIVALVVSSFGGGMIGSEETMVRLDIRASTIEIGPSIMSLAQEIEEWVVVYERDNNERAAKTLSLVREWERNLVGHNFALHSSLADVALPLPRAFAASLAEIRLASSSGSPLRRQHQQRQNTGETTSFKRRLRHLNLTKRVGHKKSGFMSIHMHITGFRVVLTTEPASNVYLSLFLDERGGSIDLFIKRISERPPSWFRGSTGFIPPVVSFVLSVRRLRVECQAKLEVKTLEVFLPEVEVCAAVRRRCGKWAVTSVCIHLPPETSGSAGLEMTVRAPHVSQLFIVQELWHKSLCESLQSIRQMFARGAHIIKENAKMNVIIQRRMESIRQGFSEETLLLVVTGAHGKVRLDLGSGNAQQASLGGVGLVLHLVRPVSRAWRKMCFDVAVRTLMLRSEGVLSGVASLDNVYLKAFLIENASDAAVLMRSPAGRTFREVLCMQKLHAVFKERQLKDVFECHVTEFRASCLDGVGEEDYTTVEADVFLSRSSVVVTPSTVPAFLNTITSFSDIVAAQRKITATKLLDSGAYTAQASRTRKLEDVVGRSEWTPVFRASATPNESTLSPSVTLSLNDNNVVVTSDKDDGGNSSGRDNSAEKIHAECFAFMGNALTRIPCGQIHIKLEQTTLLLGSAPTGANSAGSLIASFPMAALSFAECPSEAGTVVKKVLVLDTENMELFRPGVVKVLILGFRGVNKFEFYSRQKIGDGEVGFMLTLDQAHPWTGNPRFQDFQELIQLIRSFTAKSNAEVFHKFGRADQAWDEGRSTGTPSANAVADVSVDDAHAAESTAVSKTRKPMDERTLKALRNVKFSPQLRFGGDVAVNIDVILNWLGISEKMLPHILHVQMGDKMERLLSRLADKVSERVTRTNSA